MSKITLNRHPLSITPECGRVVLRSFLPSDEKHIRAIIERTLRLNEEEVRRAMEELEQRFGTRHRSLESMLLSVYERVLPYIIVQQPLSSSMRLLIGAQFCGEYAVECAALFNPSMVLHPDQANVPAGGARFLMSLRSVGEGHISSIQFRQGIVDGEGGIRLDPPTGFATLADIRPDQRYKRKKVVYAVDFSPAFPVDERVLFPVSANESNGIEDARFVRFVEDDGSVTFYATYTAYNGHSILPQLIETDNFLHFRVLTLSGSAVQNKGMALFPRRINGRYAMLSRQDNENLLIMFSDDPHIWSDASLLITPANPWESVKIGNCGSPIETEAGWLVITHGVGPMRTYCLGAVLLDLDDPTKLIGRLTEPLLKAEEHEREGYVPNVVYSCGSLLHGRSLILPYALSDRTTTIATLSLDDLLAALLEKS